MKHDSNPTTMLIGLACGCEATLKRNIADGLDMVELRLAPNCKRHLAAPTLPAPVIGFGPLWTWDANVADRRALPAASVARFEREHVYKLLEGYCYLDLPGHPGYGPLAKIRWVEPAAQHH